MSRSFDEAYQLAQQHLLDLHGLEKTPESLLLKTRLAQLRELQGRIDDAIALYDEVLSAAPNAMLAVNNYASLISDHRADNAKLLERAYRIAGRLRESSFPHYRDTFAWTVLSALAGEVDAGVGPDDRVHIVLYKRRGTLESA